MPKPPEPPDKETPEGRPSNLNEDFERILETRRIFLFGEIDTHLAKNLVEALLLLDEDAPGEDIDLIINSSGGDYYSAVALYDTFQMLHSDVRTITLGAAESAAAFIAAVGTKGKRFAGRASRFMLHQVHWDAEAKVKDMELRVVQLRRLNDDMDRILAEVTGQPYEKIQHDFEYDFWLDAEGAKAYGLVDEVL